MVWEMQSIYLYGYGLILNIFLPRELLSSETYIFCKNKLQVMYKNMNIIVGRGEINITRKYKHKKLYFQN